MLQHASPLLQGGECHSPWFPLLSLSSLQHPKFASTEGVLVPAEGGGCPVLLKLPNQAVSLLSGSSFESLQPAKGIEAKSLISWGSAQTTSSYAKQKADIYIPFLPLLVVLSNENVHGGCASRESRLATCTRTCSLEKVCAGTTVMLLTPQKGARESCSSSWARLPWDIGLSVCESDALRLSRR